MNTSEASDHRKEQTARGEFLHVCEVVWDSDKLVAVAVTANHMLLAFCKQIDVPNTKPAGHAQTVTI